MATVVSHIVDTGGTGSYTSLAAWETAQQRDLVALDEIAEARCIATTGLADTSAVLIAGWTVDATRYVYVTGEDSAHNGIYDTSKYRMDRSTISSILFIATAFTFINKIQLRNTSSGTLVTSTSGLSAGQYLKLNGVLVNGNSTAGGGITLTQSTGAYYLQNCIVYDVVVSTGFGYDVRGASGTTKLFNCSAYNCIVGFAFILSPIVRNCWAQNCTNGFNGAVNAASSNNCSDIVADAPGSSPSTGDIIFVNEAGDNFHLDSTDVVARNAGADLSADANNPVTTDVDGDARPQQTVFDIGFDEFVPAAGGDVVISYGKSHHVSYVTSDGGTIKATGVLDVHKVTVSNTGTTGTSGWLELRDGVLNGTIRYRFRILATSNTVRDFDFFKPLLMPNGLRVQVSGLTNWEAQVEWVG